MKGSASYDHSDEESTTEDSFCLQVKIIIIIIIMVFIKRPMLVVPFLKCCTYIETRDIK